MKLRNTKAHKQQRGVAASTSRSPQTNVQLEGFWLYLARGAWISFLLVELLILIMSLVATRGESYSICPFIVDCTVSLATAQALHHVSIAPSSYASYNLVLALLQSLVFLGVGGLIFWRTSSEPIALVASFFFVSIGLAPFFPPTPPSTYQPEVIFSNIYGLCVFTALGFFLVTFPDGRFVPRWSWSLAVLWLVLAGFNEIPGPYNINSWPPLLNAAVEVLTYGGTLGVLIYRYVWVFSYSQRQQAKWLLFGFGGVFVLILLYGIIGSLVPGLGAPDSFYQLANGTLTTLTFLFLPLSIGIAILRAKLWDIDVLIRRTIVYSTLTVILVVIYVGLVLVFGTLLRHFLGQEENPLVIVASTLMIAALFQPLRHGIQRVIDRRFYRRKYDAAKTLEAFSATLRNEIDLNELREHLITVVQDTMQPAHVSLWLREPASKRPRPDGMQPRYRSRVKEFAPMMGKKERNFAPLINVSVEQLVPHEHFYRHLERTLDLSFVREFVEKTYAHSGRPSIDPVVFFKLHLVMFFEGIRSERQLMRHAADRLSVRWFLGYEPFRATARSFESDEDTHTLWY